MKYYGEMHREGNQWVIRAEPHVMRKLKRLMPRINKHMMGEVRLADSPEVCEDLRWFTTRYPFLGMKDVLEGAAQYVEQMGLVEKMLGGHVPPPEFELDLPAREYQRVAAGAALALGGLLVADDVGLGKTCSAICMLADRRALPALVVTLTHLPRQWESELKKFASRLRVHVIRVGTPYDLTQWRGKKVPFPDVIIINYHKLSGWAETLAPLIRSITFDEIQELRHQGSAKYQAATHLSKAASYRIGLSATPIYNYGGEFFSVMEALRPGALGDYEEFQREWCVTSYNDKPRIKDPKAFGAYLRDAGLMLRRTRHDVGRELPALTKIPYEIDSDAAELEKVGGAADELARIILTQGEAHKGQKWQAAEGLSNILRQATGIAKSHFVAEFVRLLVESGERVVLYGWHRAVYEIWLQDLANLEPVLYTGSESPAQKEAAKQKFISGEAKVLIISLRAGAGLDGLQAVCRTVVIGELDWSPGCHEQCLSEDTEVLTLDGFKHRDYVNVGDLICGFDQTDGSMRWVSATAKTDRLLASGERMFAVATEKVDVCVTEDHRMIVRGKRRTVRGIERTGWGVETAGVLAGKARRFIPTCGLQQSRGVPLTDYELRLIGWFLTDGGLNKQTRSLHVYQAAHQPWNRDIIEVLDGCGLSWSVTKRVVPSGTLMNTYRVPKNRGAAPGRGWSHLLPYLDKNISPLLDGLTRGQLIKMLHGIKMGDGNKSSVNVIRVTSTNKQFLDRLQSLCVRRGFSANISERKSKTKAGRAAYDIWISEDREASVPRHDKPNGLAPVPTTNKTRVWCLTNELGTLVTRRNGKVAIVGNCIGRVYRDGQPDPVMAYFLIADSGSDPTVVDVLGLKTQQIEGVRDPNAALVENLDVGEGKIQKLAEAYLKQRAKK